MSISRPPITWNVLLAATKSLFFLATVAFEEAGLNKNSKSEILHLNCLQAV